MHTSARSSPYRPRRFRVRTKIDSDARCLANHEVPLVVCGACHGNDRGIRMLLAEGHTSAANELVVAADPGRHRGRRAPLCGRTLSRWALERSGRDLPWTL